MNKNIKWIKADRLDRIYDALDKGYKVEIDVWYENKQWWLGKNKPTWKTGTSILRNPKVLCIAQNREAYDRLVKGNL